MALVLARMQSERNMQQGQRLGFFDRFVIGLDLLRTCGRVLLNEPTLLVVPLIALVISLVVGTGYVFGFGFDVLFEGGKLAVALKVLPLVFALQFIGVLSQAVIVDGATSALVSHRANLHRSFQRALGRLPALAAFGAMSVIQRMISAELRDRPLLRFLGRLFDRAWDFATLLSVPVIMFERVGGLASVKRSAQLARQRWASQLVAMGALRLAMTVVSLPLLLVVLPVWFLAGTVVAIVYLCLVVIALVLLSDVLNGILSAVMYRYATTGEVVIGFTERDMWQLFGRSPAS